MRQASPSSDDHDRLHAKWIELCALSTANEISKEEQKKLGRHLKRCCSCRDIYSQYSAIIYEGMPSLDGYLEYPKTEGGVWDNSRLRRSLVAETPPPTLSWLSVHAGAFARRRLVHQISWASLTLLVGFMLSGGGYLFGRRVQSDIHRGLYVPTDVSTVTRPNVLSTATAQAGLASQRIRSLQAEGYRGQRLIEQLTRKLEHAEERAKQLAEDKANEDRALDSLLSTREALVGQVRDSSENNEQAQIEIATLRKQIADDALRSSSLRSEIVALKVNLSEEEKHETEETQYLASDRDIRDLMGARQLYIADVTDVDATGKTRKPFGRVFYTKGKSLIFYAFDLNQQPGAGEMSTYQAWAREGSDTVGSTSLGIFYVDNEESRRWVLRTDNSAALQQINSVFVTVEPRGGSRKPTGKPLLYAYLRSVSPNHP
jgi:hypothetical protein